MFKGRSTLVHFVGVLLFVYASAVAQTTTFTYQGKLTEAGSPASGPYQMQFKLFDAVSGGAQIGVTLTDVPVTATQGIFTVKLDFGASAFSGENRWLEIAVRRSPGESYATLAPREQITSAPYSVRTLSAASADVATNALNLGGTPAAQFVQTNDSRLTDDRNPLAGSSNYIQNTTTQQTSSNFHITGTGKADILDAATQFNISGNRILANAGTGNLFAGVGAGGSNSSGSNNSFFGSNTGNVNTTGQFNSSFGASAGRFNSTSNHNSFFGYAAGSSTTSGGNSYFGSLAGSGGFAPDTGNNNSFFGYRSGQFISTGHNNAFFGSTAGANNSTGMQNAFFGSEAGLNTTSGSNNTFFGFSAGRANTEGQSNAFFGFSAGMNSTGYLNVFIGKNAGMNTTIGSSNVFIGADTGESNTAGNKNTVIGDLADVFGGLTSYQTVIGAGAIGNGNSSVTLGRANGSDRVIISGPLIVRNRIVASDNSSTASLAAYNDGTGPALFANSYTGYAAEFAGTGSIRVRGQLHLDGYADGGNSYVCRVGIVFANCGSSIRYKTDVQSFTGGVEVVNRLNPVSYNWRSDGTPDVGFIAEEVARHDPRFVTYNDRGEIEGLKYDRLTTVLVNAIKEQQAQIEQQKAQIDAQKEKDKLQQKQIERQQAQVDALRTLVCSQNQRKKICKEND